MDLLLLMPDAPDSRGGSAPGRNLPRRLGRLAEAEAEAEAEQVVVEWERTRVLSAAVVVWARARVRE
jgi:hypothetical protein